MQHDLLTDLVDWIRSRHFGKYRGLVVDNRDDTRRGRIKVTVPAVLGPLEVWAMPCVPYAGNQVGFFSLPAPGTGVWIEFEAGDCSFPIWTGCFWASGEAPVDGDPEVKTWQTESLTVRLDDGADELLLRTGSKASIEMNGAVVTTAGRAKHSVGSAGVESAQGGRRIIVNAATVTVG